MSFKDIPIDILKEIAELTFCDNRRWVTSEINVRYNEFIPEHYEDASEYWEMIFDGYFAGDNTAKYEVRLYPNFDVFIWYSYKEEKNIVHHPSSQSKVQELLNPHK
jgi:hypothetical protein